MDIATSAAEERNQPDERDGAEEEEEGAVEDGVAADLVLGRGEDHLAARFAEGPVGLARRLELVGRHRHHKLAGLALRRRTELGAALV